MDFLNEEIKENIRELINTEGTLGGVYLATFTGELLSDDDTYAEVIFEGKSVFAKVCNTYGGWTVPDVDYLKEHGENIRAWVAFENGNPAHPVILGVNYLDNKDNGNKTRKGKSYQSKYFRYWFNDEEKSFELLMFDNEHNLVSMLQMNEHGMVLTDSKNKTKLEFQDGNFSLENKEGIKVKTSGKKLIASTGQGQQALIKGTDAIQAFTSIFQKLMMPMAVSGTQATYDPATASQLTTEIGQLTQLLSTEIFIE